MFKKIGMNFIATIQKILKCKKVVSYLANSQTKISWLHETFDFCCTSVFQVVFDLFCDLIIVELLQNFLVRGHSLTYKIFLQFASKLMGVGGESSSLTLRFDT